MKSLLACLLHHKLIIMICFRIWQQDKWWWNKCHKWYIGVALSDQVKWCLTMKISTLLGLYLPSLTIMERTTPINLIPSLISSKIYKACILHLINQMFASPQLMPKEILHLEITKSSSRVRSLNKLNNHRRLLTTKLYLVSINSFNRT